MDIMRKVVKVEKLYGILDSPAAMRIRFSPGEEWMIYDGNEAVEGYKCFERGGFFARLPEDVIKEVFDVEEEEIKTSTDESKKSRFIWECAECGARHEYNFGYCPNCGKLVTKINVIKRFKKTEEEQKA